MCSGCACIGVRVRVRVYISVCARVRVYVRVCVRMSVRVCVYSFTTVSVNSLCWHAYALEWVWVFVW